MGIRCAVGLTFAAICLSGVARADSYRFVRLDMPGCDSTAARGMNNAGQVVGTCTRAGGTIGFVWSGGVFTPLEFPGADVTSPSAIDSAGRIAGFYTTAGSPAHGFLYAAGVFTTIDAPGAASTEVLGMNDAGDTVGTFTDGRGRHGFHMAGGIFTVIDVPGAASTSATAINSEGDIAGTASGADPRVHGFLYSGGTFTRLDAPDGDAVRSLGIDDAGEIAGLSRFLYRAGVFVAIDSPGAPAKLQASAIAPAGTIAGSFPDGSGALHGFLAIPARAASAHAGGGTVAAAPSPRISVGGSCNILGDGVPTVADIQSLIRQALGVSPAANDLNTDQAINVADIQLIINASREIGCTPPGGGTVAQLSVQSGNGQVACICITATLQAFQPISVKATDSQGNPVAGATVNWSVTSGQMNIASPTSLTDSNGIATQNISLLVLNNFTSSLVPYLVSTVQASSNNQTVTFTETQSLVTSQGSSVIEANPPQFGGQQLGGQTLSAPIGTTLATPIQTQIAGLFIASNGVPNVSVRILNAQTSPALTCVTGQNADPGSVLSDAQGNTSCYPKFSGSGGGMFYIQTGGVAASDFASALYLDRLGPFSFTSNAGAPAAVQIVSGNNQVVPIGQQFSPLVARLVDGQGNIIPGQTMAWSVLPAGAASLNNAPVVTDATGQVSITGSLNILASAGVTITVALASNPAISAAFQETVPNAITAMTKISGDNQTAAKGAAFPAAITVKLSNASGPVAFIPVHFNASGPVTLSAGVAFSDTNGLATVTATAGASSGTATITAVAGAISQTFTLTVQ